MNEVKINDILSAISAEYDNHDAIDYMLHEHGFDDDYNYYSGDDGDDD